MHFDLHDPTFWVMIAFFGFIGLLYYYKVHKAVGKSLDGRARPVLRMRFELDLVQWEIADRVGVSQMHVSRLLRRSLDRLSAAGAIT